MENKLNDLEERAEELDKKRTSTISSVALINNRNRKANVSKAEDAIMVEIKRKEEEGEVFLPLKTKNSNFPYQNYEAFKYRRFFHQRFLKNFKC